MSAAGEKPEPRVVLEWGHGRGSQWRLVALDSSAFPQIVLEVLGSDAIGAPKWDCSRLILSNDSTKALRALAGHQTAKLALEPLVLARAKELLRLYKEDKFPNHEMFEDGVIELCNWILALEE